ncbi:MAG: glycosyltransferase [Bacteroidota bacterium]|jgi:glycosyltransferase involved in cell wall biosynthesis
MRILLLSDINSVHTQKWAIGLSSAGLKIGLFSMNRSNSDWYSSIPNITILSQANQQLKGVSFIEKAGYFSYLKSIKRSVSDFKPDIVHAHYASSYGMLGALSGFHPFIISVWGADVYDFPAKSFLNKALLKFNLRKADRILSTSEVMKIETMKYTSSDVGVTPFGVDTEVFYPRVRDELVFSKSDIVIGQVKSLEQKYGTSVLIDAFKLVTDTFPNLSLKLLLVGGGSLYNDLIEKTKQLGISDNVIFTGSVLHSEIAKYHNMIDIFVSASIDDSESFGVSAVEACACAKAVVVARTGGLKEVVLENETGLIAERGDANSTADAISKFISSPELRKLYGERARQHVLKRYDWKKNLSLMIEIYKDLIRR